MTIVYRSREKKMPFVQGNNKFNYGLRTNQARRFQSIVHFYRVVLVFFVR